MTKKQSVVLAIASFVVGMTLGMLLAGNNGKVVINGDNNKVRTGYKSYDGNHNGSNNTTKSKKQGK